MSPSPPNRIPRVSRLAVILVGLGLVFAVTSCDAEQAPREDFFYVNQQRVAQGDHALGWNRTSAAKAQAWAPHMADTNTLSHSVLTDGVGSGWSTLGENVGTGGAVHDVHVGFMNSPVHRADILNPSFSSMGVGVAQSGGRIWVAAVFEGRGLSFA